MAYQQAIYSVSGGDPRPRDREVLHLAPGHHDSFHLDSLHVVALHVGLEDLWNVMAKQAIRTAPLHLDLRPTALSSRPIQCLFKKIEK